MNPTRGSEKRYVRTVDKDWYEVVVTHDMISLMGGEGEENRNIVGLVEQKTIIYDQKSFQDPILVACNQSCPIYA